MNKSGGMASGNDSVGASVSKGAGHFEGAEAHGHYEFICHGPDGKVKWEDKVENLVTTVGKNFALDTFLAGSAYTVTGPYLGLINASASTAVIGDTMASHATWLEVGGANAPTYTSGRKTLTWAAAVNGGKASNSVMTFAITSTGTVGGCFLVFGPGAVGTVDSGAGILYSAGAFTGGSKTVANFDSLTVNYVASL